MQRWTVHLEGGPRRVNHAAVSIGDFIFSFGGYCTGEDYKTTRPMDVHVLNTVSYRWHALPTPNKDSVDSGEMPYQRYGHTAVDYDSAAFIWGGRNDIKGACSILYKFESRTQVWSRVRCEGLVPGARDGHSACIIKDKMYIFGGYEEDVDKFANEVHALDMKTYNWQLLEVRGKPARWRDFHTAVGIDEYMVIFGGRSDRGGPYHTSLEIYCDKVQLFDTRLNTWHQPDTTGLQPTGRRSHSAFTYNNKMYIFGGYDGIHNIHFDDVYRFDLSNSEWSLIKVGGHNPCPRRRQCCCVIKDRVFVFGGTSPCTVDSSAGTIELQDQSDLHVLDFAPTLRTLCLLKVVEYRLDQTMLPRNLQLEITAMTVNNSITRPVNTNG